MFLYGFNPLTLILAVFVMIFALWAQSRVKRAFKKWSRISAQGGLTASDAARKILDSSGLKDVPVNRQAGHLTDNYNPARRTLNLSQNVFGSDSIAAIGIAAHEAGHAIQHKNSFLPLVLRSTVYPLARLGSGLAFPLFFIGMIMQFNPVLIRIAIYLFLFAFLFTIITLPVEFNASSRAKKILYRGGYLTAGEMQGANAVLDAAALTYVAAALQALVQLLRMVLLSRGRN